MRRISTVNSSILLKLKVIIFATLCAIPLRGDEPPPGSPEAIAREAAAKYEKSQKLRIRQDFWSGELTGAKGKAIRLQFFKGHRYRVFLAPVCT